MLVNPKQQAKDIALFAKNGADIIIDDSSYPPIGVRVFVENTEIRVYIGQVLIAKICYYIDSLSADYVWINAAGYGDSTSRDNFFRRVKKELDWYNQR